MLYDQEEGWVNSLGKRSITFFLLSRLTNLLFNIIYKSFLYISLFIQFTKAFLTSAFLIQFTKDFLTSSFYIQFTNALFASQFFNTIYKCFLDISLFIQFTDASVYILQYNGSYNNLQGIRKSIRVTSRYCLNNSDVEVTQGGLPKTKAIERERGQLIVASLIQIL